MKCEALEHAAMTTGLPMDIQNYQKIDIGYESNTFPTRLGREM